MCWKHLRKHHTEGKQEKLQTRLSDHGQALPGSPCGHTLMGLLVCTLGATGELGVWENRFKVNLMSFPLEMRVSLWALTPAGLFVTSVKSLESLAGIKRCLVCHFLLVGNTKKDLFVFKNCLGFVKFMLISLLKMHH